MTLDLERDNPETIKAKLGTLPALAATPIQVTMVGGQDIGFTITVTFDPAATPGNLPELKVLDATKVTGELPELSQW